MKKKALSLFLAWAMCLTMLPAALADEAPETEPAAQTAEEPESEPAVQTEQTMSESELLSDISNYHYATLTGNITLTSTLQITDTATLDLNGYSISLNAEGAVIFVTNNATLTLNDSSWGDGTITHGYDSASGHTYYGTGVKVDHGTFAMNGGTITGNVDGIGYGKGCGAGGVVVDCDYNYPQNIYSTFTMTGGAITGNSAPANVYSAGGVYVRGSSSMFEMTGGTISHNICSNNGGSYGLAGGVYVRDAACTLSGGTISDNSISDTATDTDNLNAAGGVRVCYLNTGRSFSIGGTIQITGNTYNGEANNLLLDNRQYLPISSGNPLTGKAKIGVSTYNKPTAGTDVTIVDYISSPGNYLQYLSSDNDAYDIVAENHTLLLRKYNHRHDDGVGFAHELTSQDGALYIDGKEQSTLNGNYSLSDTSYYLGGDLELNNTLEMGMNTTLCLNGHNITTTVAQSTIYIYPYGTSYKGFSLYDCEPDGKYGTITHADGVNGYGIYGAESFNLYGGHFDKCSPHQIVLTEGKTVNISKAQTADVYVGTTATTESGEYTALVKGVNGYTLTAADLAHFKSSDGYTPQIMNNTIIFVNGDAKHIHSVCADANCTDTTHTDLIWKPIDSESALRGITEAGNYYLTTDITLNDTTWAPVNGVVLCLNGHDITANGSFDAITVDGSDVYFAKFTLTDCKGDKGTYGKITHSGASYGTNDIITYKGSGVSVKYSTFNMYGGEISNNWLSGVLVEAGQELADSDYKGGGVSVGYSGTFNMYGGTITKNVAINVGGGGIGLGGNYASANLLGGSITGNYGEPYTSVAGGIFLKEGSLTVGGDVQIIDNKTKQGLHVASHLTGGDASNLYLAYWKTIHLDSSLNNNARVGIGAEQPPYLLNPVQITNDDATSKTLNYLNIFSTDARNKSHVIIHQNNNLYISPHQHNWTYSASDDHSTITAKCTATGCPLTDGVGGTYTLKTQDTKPTYDGTVKSLTDCVNKSDSTLPDATIVCKQNGEDAEFKNAGDYDISFKLGDVESAPKTYTIEKAELTADDFTFTAPDANDLVYNGKEKTVSVTSDDVTDSDITVHYFRYGEETAPVNAGDYTFTIDVKETKNFKRMLGRSPFVKLT